MLQPFEIPQEVLDADETIIGNVHAFCSAVERGLFWHMWDILCAEAVALYVQNVPQYTSGFHESMCEGRAAVNLAALCPRSGRGDRHAWPAFWSWRMPIACGAPWKRSSAARGIRC